MNKKYPGLAFEKFDLHVHTPASHDFPDKAVTPENIVNRALSAGLRGIAVTDHHTGEFIDKVKAAAKGKSLVVFPGVEICCTGGKSGIHIIAILGAEKTKAHIESLLSSVGFGPDDLGKKDAVTTMSPSEVISKIATAPYEGIAVLAHCTSSKGVLCDITGKTREKIFENPGLLAVEVSANNFLDAEKEREGKRAVDLLNGKDENYAFRRLGVYVASDSRGENDEQHSITGIGAKWTWLKVDAEPSLESLRQCFIDRDVRIRQQFQIAPGACSAILQIKVTGGFFDGSEADCHGGLNSILGAKGAGKSLLVTLMRFGLGQVPAVEDIRDDFERKLEKRLEVYGRVSMKIRDETGVVHDIERVYDPSQESYYPEAGHESVASSFEALFLSQNEIVRIAENEDLQIGFIDRFFDFRHYRNRIAIVESDLGELDIQFADALRATHLHGEAAKQIEGVKTRLAKLDKLLADPIYSVYKQAEEKDQILRTQYAFLTQIKTAVLNTAEGITKTGAPDVIGTLAKDPALRRSADVISSARETAANGLRIVVEGLEKAAREVSTEHKKWSVTYSQEKAKYQEHMRSVGGDKKELEAQRVKLVKEMSDLARRNQALTTKKESLKAIRKIRDEKIDELFSVYSEYSAERKAKCEKFERESNGRLQVRLRESTNLGEFKSRLKALKKGSYLRDVEVDRLCEGISPREFILDLLRFQLVRDPKKIVELARKTRLEKDRLLSLCEFLLAEVPYEELLALQYRAHPEDRPEINFRVAEDRYEPVRDISVGQKCTAMLVMALSEGRFPIVIDQPEDSLDVRSVWEDMCLRVRRGKEQRQFIFTTHNSCLAVASDTDKYIVVENVGGRGGITMSGALESGPVKEEVIRYLEGGRETYLAKSQKYGKGVDSQKGG